MTTRLTVVKVPANEMDEGVPHLVNFAHVEHVSPGPYFVRLHFVSGESLNINATMEDVLQLLNGPTASSGTV